MKKNAHITATDLQFLRRTLLLARRGGKSTLPNPQVGALIVKNKKIIAEGYHKKAGEPHAEINAIAQCKKKSLRGATLYTNLEPCCHTKKRTPPCTEAIKKTGITRVVTIMRDPNPQVKGKGITELHGICLENLTPTSAIKKLVHDAQTLNEVFTVNIKFHRPFVTLKLGMSLDGEIATHTGESQWITNQKARLYGHKLRAGHQAIMVGMNTVLHDNPGLTTHRITTNQPLRIVLDRSLKTPLNAQIIGPHTLIITTAQASSQKRKMLEKKGVQTLILPYNTPLRTILKTLWDKGITHILVEGGATLASGLIAEKLVDKMYFFYAPLLIGGEKTAAIGGKGIEKLSAAPRYKIQKIQKIDDNFLVIAKPI